MLRLANTASSQTYTDLGLAVPPPARLKRHINPVTWMLGLALLIGITVIGRHGWEWQAPLALLILLMYWLWNQMHPLY